MRPRRMCSVPTYSCLRRRASSRAIARTLRTRSVKLKPRMGCLAVLLVPQVHLSSKTSESIRCTAKKALNADYTDLNGKTARIRQLQELWELQQPRVSKSWLTNDVLSLKAVPKRFAVAFAVSVQFCCSNPCNPRSTLLPLSFGRHCGHRRLHGTIERQ